MPIFLTYSDPNISSSSLECSQKLLMLINCTHSHSLGPLVCLPIKALDFMTVSHSDCFLYLTLFLNLIVTNSTACLMLSLQSQGGNPPVHRSLSITHKMKTTFSFSLFTHSTSTWRASLQNRGSHYPPGSLFLFSALIA